MGDRLAGDFHGVFPVGGVANVGGGVHVHIFRREEGVRGRPAVGVTARYVPRSVAVEIERIERPRKHPAPRPVRVGLDHPALERERDLLHLTSRLGHRSDMPKRQGCDHRGEEVPRPGHRRNPHCSLSAHASSTKEGKRCGGNLGHRGVYTLRRRFGCPTEKAHDPIIPEVVDKRGLRAGDIRYRFRAAPMAGLVRHRGLVASATPHTIARASSIGPGLLELVRV